MTVENGNKKFDGRTHLFDYEYFAFLKNVPARWTPKNIINESNCVRCNREGDESNPIQRAHEIGFVNGIVRFGLTPEFLDRTVNLIPAHAIGCNDAVELDDGKTIQKLKEFYKVTELPKYLPEYIQHLWYGTKRENEDSFWPPIEPLSKIIPYNLGFGGKMFLTFEEWITFLRRTPNHGPIDKPIKTLCELSSCGLAGTQDSPLQNAHKIGFAPGIKRLALTPDFLNSTENLMSAHRTRRHGFKCNKLCELDLQNSMSFLKSLGVLKLPDFLPKTTLDLWNRI